MKKYQLYGLGNALVDIEYEVSLEELAALGVDKDLMTLVDSERSAVLLAELAETTAHKACGGSAGNTMALFGNLGGRGYFSCKVASDHFGDFYFQELRDNGIDTNLTVGNRDEGVTGTCITLVTPDTHRSMCTHLGTTATFSENELNVDAIKDSEYLYIEGYLVASDSARPAAIAAREMAESHGVKTTMTLSDPNMTDYFHDGLSAIIGKQVDILFCNEQEVLSFLKAKDLTQASEGLRQYAKQFVITRSEQGALLFDGEQFHEAPGNQVNAVSSVGAGDTFAGAFLYAITHGENFFKAGEFANLCAAQVVTQPGPRLTEARVEAIVAARAQLV